MTEMPTGGNGLRTINAIAHCEDGLWWAESPDVPELCASASSREELFRLARDGLVFWFGHDRFTFALWDELPPNVQLGGAAR
jgi:predicted RNase H-like HicB family nuclease